MTTLVKSKPQSTQRTRSQAAVLAIETLGELQKYFEYANQLAEALGWDPDTVSDWLSDSVVRPQAKKVAQVILLQELCLEARAYLRSDSDVGIWLTSPSIRLEDGVTPSEWLLERGALGLRELTADMSSTMPKTPVGEIEPVDETKATIVHAYAASKGDAGALEAARLVAELD